MTDTSPIFTKLALALQYFLLRTYITNLMKIRETVDIVADTSSWSDVVSEKAFFFCDFLTNVKKLMCCCQRS
jgi:hypothetical protein